MSYDLYGGETNLGQLASNNGWYLTAKFIRTTNYPELRKFANQGYSEDLAALRVELKEIHSSDPDTEDVLRNFADLLDRTDEPVVILYQ